MYNTYITYTRKVQNLLAKLTKETLATVKWLPADLVLLDAIAKYL